MAVPGNATAFSEHHKTASVFKLSHAENSWVLYTCHHRSEDTEMSAQTNMPLHCTGMLAMKDAASLYHSLVMVPQRTLVCMALFIIHSQLYQNEKVWLEKAEVVIKH